MLQKFEKILNKNGIQENPANEDNKTPKMTCFNCLGNHNLKDCTQPRNQANINKHRKDFNSRQRSNTRYHQDDDQKFDHLVPGKLSDNLKQALNLKENELPRYIYRLVYSPDRLRKTIEIYLVRLNFFFVLA